jgi:flagellar assembly factor FliW
MTKLQWKDANDVTTTISPATTEHEDATMAETAPPEHDGIPVLQMIEPLAGFAEHTSFALVRLDEEGTICELQAIDRPDLSFLVVPPHAFFPDYAPLIDETTQKVLEIHDADDVLLLVMVNPGSTLAETTANLLAPVLVNHRTRRAAQIVLDDSSLPLRAPLAAA